MKFIKENGNSSPNFSFVNYYIHNNMANAMREERPTTKVEGTTLNTSLGHVIQFTSEFCAGKCEKRKDESLSVI